MSIIDGQQRLTTVTLLYVAIHSFAGELGNARLQEKINKTYLINEFADSEEKLKLRPTENNDNALKYLLRHDKSEEYISFSRLVDNFDFFKKRLTEKNLETVLRGLDKLMFVEISLDREKDDPQRIFESLNSTGLELSQADLIRNYILMSLTRKDQIRIYEKYWEIIEQQAQIIASSNSQVSNFVRDFLILENKKIPNKSKVYYEFKSLYPTGTVEELEQNLARLKKLVKHYNKLLNPKNEPNLNIRQHLEYINRLEINVSYPFLIQIYDDYDNETLTKDEFVYILELIQSFAWRRFIVGLGTNALNKIFMTLYSNIDHNDYIASLEFALIKKRGAQRFPSNTEVINTLKEKDMYSIKSRNRAYFLERLENHNNNEYVQVEGNQKITIEHIFPQNPDKKWLSTISQSDYDIIKDNYLNTISNLTLSGNNGPLSNKVFLEKQNMNKDNGEQGYNYSRLWLNRYLSEIDSWDVSTLNKRFEIISNRFKQIWKYPEMPTQLDKENEISVFEIFETLGKKLDYVILFNQKLVFNSIGDLYERVIQSLFEKDPERFFATDLMARLQMSKNKEDLRRGIQVNDTYYIEANLNNNQFISRIRNVLEAFKLEDDLYIQWKDETN